LTDSQYIYFMKPYLTSIILMLFAFTAKSQLAIINDPDGFVNVRKERSPGAGIVDRLYTGQVFLFYTENDKDEWIDVDFDNNSLKFYNQIYIKKYPKHISGFISRSRLMPLENLPHKKLTKFNRTLSASQAILKVDSTVLIIKTRQFNNKGHYIHHAKGSTIVDKIDDKLPIGVDGGLPSVEISVFSLNINNKAITIPRTSFTDIYQPNIKNLNIYSDKKGNIYLYMPGNSDGAGAYDVVWIVNSSKLVCRYVYNID